MTEKILPSQKKIYDSENDVSSDLGLLFVSQDVYLVNFAVKANNEG